jgi:hypothetical protein
MSDGELKFSRWQSPVQELMLEFDREKLPEKLQGVETLIFERFQQLGQESSARAGRQALSEALNILRIIKHVRKLPDDTR